MITITVDTSRFDRMMADFPAAMARAKKNALYDVGRSIARIAKDSFTKDPSLRPSPWAPRKDKKSTHPLLIKSGNLRQSISWKLDGPDTVVIGSSQKYAPYHQHGTKNMPARPFFPIDRYGNLTPSVAGKINRTVERIYVEELGKLGG
jgi:phage gpG-like protein